MAEIHITSPDNAKVKLARKLRERKARAETGLFYIEGLRILGEAADLDADVEYVLAAPELVQSATARELIKRFRAAGTPLYEVTAGVFRSFSLKEGPQGLAAVVRQRWERLENVELGREGLWVALDEIADPGNLGTILRTADAAGADGIILLGHATDPYDPTAVRASMGAIFAQPVARATLEEFTAWKRARGAAVVGTSGAAQADYHQAAYPEALVLLMGSERQGLDERHLALCDEVVRIPMQGRSDSLNLAVATALMLYEVFNRRRAGGGTRGTTT